MKKRRSRLSQAPAILPGHPEVTSFAQAAGFHCRDALTIPPSATCIAMLAARQAVELTDLDVQASSRSDAGGILGTTEPGNERVSPGPRDMQLRVRIAARNATSLQLRALVENACTCSPVSAVLLETTPIHLHIEEGTA